MNTVPKRRAYCHPQDQQPGLDRSQGCGWGCCKELMLGRFNNDDFDDLLTVESATGKMRIYPGTASGAQFGAGVDAGGGTGWLNRGGLVPIVLGQDTRSGLLAKADTGALVFYPARNSRSIDWSDPIAFGPRD